MAAKIVWGALHVRQPNRENHCEELFSRMLLKLSLIEVLEAANGNGVSKSLNDAKAGRAATHIQRALFTRMHMIIARHYMPHRRDDLTAGRAFELLQDAKVRTAAVSNAANMTNAETR